jgi:hypothetical protein
MHTKQRTDPHRPGAIIPAHYRCEVDFCAPSVSGGFPIPGFRWDCEHDLAIVERDEHGRITSSTPGTHGTHERGLCCVKLYLERNPHARHGRAGKCDVCGAHYKAGSAFLYEPTGEVVLMGHDCAQTYECLFDSSEAELHRMRQERALAVYITRAQNAKKRAAFLTKHEGLEAALALGDGQRSERGRALLADLRARFAQWCSLSEKQVALALKVAGEITNPAPKAPEAPKAKAPVTTERVVIRGRIVHTKVVEGDYGSTLKMLLVVPTPEGEWKAWGTLPSGLDRPEAGWVGHEVAITARVEPKREDPSFAFLSRPSVYVAPAPKRPRPTKAQRFQGKARDWFRHMQRTAGYWGGMDAALAVRTAWASARS